MAREASGEAAGEPLRLAASNIGWDAADDETVLARMAELGYAGVEIAPTRIVAEDPYAHAGFARSWAEGVYGRLGLRVVSMQSILFGHGESIYEPEGCRSVLDYLERACAFAEAIGCPNLVFGCPRNRSMPPGITPADARPFFLAAARAAHRHGTCVALETVSEDYGNNFLTRTADTFAYVRELGVEGLKVNLDLGAMISAGDGLEVVGDNVDLVSHVHVSEPGLAPIKPRALHRELAALLREAGYGGHVSVEMGTASASVMLDTLSYVAEALA